MISKYGVKGLSILCTMHGQNAILEAARGLGDATLLRQIEGENLINKVRYHASCYKKFMASWSRLETKMQAATSEIVDPYSQCFETLVFACKSDEGHIYEMSTLRDKYREYT